MIIIPARIASNRFPNKVLADINGLPMVVATAKRVEDIDEVVIATDSPKVIDVAKKYNIKAVKTLDIHKSGTDRINEAASIMGVDKNEIIVNVQADEPFVEPEVVNAVFNRVKIALENSEPFMMVSCYKKINSVFANDPNHVKVIIDHEGYAIYFSRSKIPFDTEGHNSYFGHLGIYGFTGATLEKFCTLGVSPLEEIEKLEQLRAIYFGKKIPMVKVESKSFGIDTKEDLKKAVSMFM